MGQAKCIASLDGIGARALDYLAAGCRNREDTSCMLEARKRSYAASALSDSSKHFPSAVHNIVQNP